MGTFWSVGYVGFLQQENEGQTLEIIAMNNTLSNSLNYHEILMRDPSSY